MNLVTLEDVAEAILLSLTPREETIMRMSYGHAPYDRNHTDEEIAEKLELTAERLENIKRKVYRKITHRVLLKREAKKT